jgi:nucleotide-binding universal stress UspA family protein
MMMTGSLDINASAVLLQELAELDQQHEKLAAGRGQLILSRAEGMLVAAGVAVVKPRLRQGDLLEVVAELEPGADMLVIGKRGEGADFARLHLGSNFDRVLRAARKPVFVASRAFKPVARALIAFDDGPSVHRAIDAIVASPLLAGVEIRLLNVGKGGEPMYGSIEGAAARLREAGFSATAEIASGEAEQVIATRVVTDNIDLLVMGASSRSRLRELFLGSTVAEVIRGCLVPVLIYH